MDAQRIPFTEEDEHRIASAATWGMVVALCGIGSSLISLVVTANMYLGAAGHLRSVAGPMLLLSGAASLITVVFNVWLLQAGLAFRKVAVTDEADQAHLLTGFRGLRAYFMSQVILILLAAVGGVGLAIAGP